MPKSSHVTLQYSFDSDIDFSINDTISSLLRRDRWQILQSELIRGEQPCWQRFETFHACKQFEDRANGRRQTASLQSRRAYTRVRRCQSARNRIRGATLLSQLGRQLISNREREGGDESCRIAVVEISLEEQSTAYKATVFFQLLVIRACLPPLLIALPLPCPTLVNDESAFDRNVCTEQQTRSKDFESSVRD